MTECSVTFLLLYTCSADGNRVKKTVGSTNFYYPFATYEISGTVAIKYYFFAGQRVAMKSGSTLTYLHGDHLGSTALATTSAGAWQSQEKYFAYGKDRDTANSVPTDHKFTGQKQDGSGLMYYSSRYYDPQIGLFVSPDTIVPDAGNVFAYNRLMYVAGNPMRLRDNSGHFWETALDVASVGYDVYDIYENGLTWSSGGALAVDLVGAAIPFVPSAGACVRWCDEAAQVGGKAAGYVGDKVDDAWKWTKGALGYGDEAAQAVNTICSFSEETLVTTNEGLKPISSLKAGDWVLAFNEETGETDYYPILDTFAHNDPQLVFLTIDGETITTTPEHPFYEAESSPWLAIGEFRYNWTPAERLNMGDFVRSADGTLGQVTKVQVVDSQQVMYNLTVTEAHTFFVGEEQWLVHNACSTKLRSAMGLTDATKQAHHIVPGQLESHQFVQDAIAGGWNIDGAMNGIALSKSNADALSAGTVAHRGPHGNYTDVVEGYLDDLYLQAQQQGWSQQRIVQELNNLITNTLVPHIQSLPAGTRLD